MPPRMTRLNQTLTPALVAIYLFLSIAAAQPSKPPSPTAPRATPQATSTHPFLWKVDGPIPSWLFGTIHSDDATVATLPASVTARLDASKSFHPEVEVSADLAATVVMKIFDPDSPDLAMRLPPGLWLRVKHAATAVDLPEPLLQRLSPGFAALLFSAPANGGLGTTVDGQLYERAVEHRLAIAALETVDEQLALFQQLPDAQAIVALTDALDEIDAGRPAGKKLLAAYASGDERTVAAAVEAEFATSPAARALAEPLLYRRNRAMADRLAPHLKAGGAFVAIGVAHLTGPRSVIELLRARGWKITRAP